MAGGSASNQRRRAGTALYVSQTGKTSGHRQTRTGRTGRNRQKRDRRNRKGKEQAVQGRLSLGFLASLHRCMQGGGKRKGQADLQRSEPSRRQLQRTAASGRLSSVVCREASEARTDERDMSTGERAPGPGRTPLHSGVCPRSKVLACIVCGHPFAFFFWVWSSLERERAVGPARPEKGLERREGSRAWKWRRHHFSDWHSGRPPLLGSYKQAQIRGMTTSVHVVVGARGQEARQGGKWNWDGQRRDQPEDDKR